MRFLPNRNNNPTKGTRADSSSTIRSTTPVNTPKEDDKFVSKPDRSNEQQQLQEPEDVQSFFDDDDDDFDARTNKVGDIIEIEIPQEYDVEMTDIWLEDDDCIECVLGAI